MKHIFKILLPGLIVLFSWACNKNYNEEVDVEFYCASKYQFHGNSLLFVDGTGNIVNIDANGIQNATAEETLRDTVLLESKEYTAIAGLYVIYYVKGRASGLTVFPGDTVKSEYGGIIYVGGSRMWEDWPLSEGVPIILDTDKDEGIISLRLGYFAAGDYLAKLVATNFYDPDSEAKEKVYSVDVKVYSVSDFENFYYNVVPDTSALKSHFGISDTLGIDAVLEFLDIVNKV